MLTAFAHIHALVLRGRERKFKRSTALDLSIALIRRPTTFFFLYNSSIGKMLFYCLKKESTYVSWDDTAMRHARVMKIRAACSYD